MLVLSDSWGDAFPIPNPDWDLILASDILLCKFFTRFYSIDWSGNSLLVVFIRLLVLEAVLLNKMVVMLEILFRNFMLRYVKQYSNLIKSLSVLLKSYKPKDSQVGHLTKNEQGEGTEGLPWPAFLMSWRRRIGKEDETIFFTSCENAGLEVKHLGSRVYCIKLR
ncbi:hypothetical protein WN943_004234 [Citrus x changshan-huyou]